MSAVIPEMRSDRKTHSVESKIARLPRISRIPDSYSQSPEPITTNAENISMEAKGMLSLWFSGFVGLSRRARSKTEDEMSIKSSASFA
jgi:hypothetical protein